MAYFQAISILTLLVLSHEISALAIPHSTYGVPSSAAATVKLEAPVAKTAASFVQTYEAPAVNTFVAAPVVKTVEFEEASAPPHYNFGYVVNDPFTGDSKSQHESRLGDSVHGSYSLIEADGTKRTVDYTADDANGFKAVVHKEPHTAPAAVVTKVVTPLVTKVSTPVVHYAAPAVTYGAPVLTHSAPALTYGKLVLTHGAPAFTYGTPALTYGAPALTYGAPALTYGTPAFTYGTPAVSGYSIATSISHAGPSHASYTNNYGVPAEHYGTPAVSHSNEWNSNKY